MTSLRWRRQLPTMATVVAQRPVVEGHWRSAVAGYDPRVPADLPGYFADRFAFALTVGRASGPSEPPGFDLEECLRRRSDLLARSLSPTRGLGEWIAAPDAVAELGPLYDDLRGRWRGFCAGIGLPLTLGSLRDHRGQTWQALFDRSLFFPRAPVISGPNFFDELDGADRDRIIGEYGLGAPVDFFCFMHQVHEHVHVHQVGEPLLNEVVQAALWMRFVTVERLWVFQRNSVTGQRLCHEARALDPHPSLADEAVTAGLDTARLFGERHAAAAYPLACLWASTFDRNRIRYAQYLDGLSWLLLRGDDVDWVARSSRRLAADLGRSTSPPALRAR